MKLIEVRSYRLKPGTLDAFHTLVSTEALPLLHAQGMNVVAHGRCDHEEQTYFLVRAYASREALAQEQAAFYGSAAWKQGPREALLAMIDTYMNTLLWVSDDAVDSIRHLNRP
jgi:hypothetical protein